MVWPLTRSRSAYLRRTGRADLLVALAVGATLEGVRHTALMSIIVSRHGHWLSQKHTIRHSKPD